MVPLPITASAAVPLLLHGDLVTEAQCDTLCARTDAHVTLDSTVRLLLHTHVSDNRFAEGALRKEVSREEVSVAREGGGRRLALHIDVLQDVVQILLERADVGAHHDLVLPFELHPHRTELRGRARARVHVVHNVDVDVVHNDHIAIVRRPRNVVHDVAEDDTSLRGRDLQVRVDLHFLARGQSVGLRALAKLQVTHGGQLDGEALEGVARLVHNQHLEQHVELVHHNRRLGVHRVAETGELQHRPGLSSLLPPELLVPRGGGDVLQLDTESGVLRTLALQLRELDGLVVRHEDLLVPLLLCLLGGLRVVLLLKHTAQSLESDLREVPEERVLGVVQERLAQAETLARVRVHPVRRLPRLGLTELDELRDDLKGELPDLVLLTLRHRQTEGGGDELDHGGGKDSGEEEVTTGQKRTEAGDLGLALLGLISVSDGRHNVRAVLTHRSTTARRRHGLRVLLSVALLLLDPQRERLHSLTEHGQHIYHLRVRVLCTLGAREGAQRPQGNAEHTHVRDGRKLERQLLHHLLPQLGLAVDHLADEVHDVNCGLRVFDDEIHQDRHDLRCYLRVPYGRVVDEADQHPTVV
eukprot:Hpha_TRINITY_DN15065_c5_g11::TRINITY_DN15065_c5_g11_i1::g.125148::m.125148